MKKTVQNTCVVRKILLCSFNWMGVCMMYENGQVDIVWLQALFPHFSIFHIGIFFLSTEFVYSFHTNSMVLCMRCGLFTLYCIAAIICELCIIIFPVWIITKLVLEVICTVGVQCTYTMHCVCSAHAATFFIETSTNGWWEKPFELPEMYSYWCLLV